MSSACFRSLFSCLYNFGINILLPKYELLYSNIVAIKFLVAPVSTNYIYRNLMVLSKERRVDGGNI